MRSGAGLLLLLSSARCMWNPKRVMEGDIFLEGVHLRGKNGKAGSVPEAAAGGPSVYAAGPCGDLKDAAFMDRATEYLPDPATRPSAPDADAARFAAEMAERNPAGGGCNPRGIGGIGWCYYGTGACMHSMRKQISASFDAGTSLKILGGKIQEGKPTDFCPSSTILCYFDQPPQQGLAKGCRDGGDRDAAAAPTKLAALFGHRGKFWLIAQQMSYVFRLSAKFAARVEALKATIGYAHPIIGMQVRHGDTCRVREVCWPLAAFMEQARRMKAKYGVKTIFLATDSEKVAAEAKSKYGGEFTIVQQEMDRSKFDLDTRSEALKHLHPGWDTGPGNFDTIHAAGLSNSNADVETILTDVELLAQADYLISAFSTNVARLAYELMVARRGCAPPFVSLDIPWCVLGPARPAACSLLPLLSAAAPMI